MFIMFINICCCCCSISNINWLFLFCILVDVEVALDRKAFLFVSNFFLLNSISCCRITICDFVFSCKNISVSESVFLCFVVDCFSPFSIDLRFTVSPKVSYDFLCMPSAFATFCSVFCFLLLFVTGILVYFLIFFKSRYYICESNVSFCLFWIDPTLPVLFPFLFFICLF